MSDTTVGLKPTTTDDRPLRDVRLPDGTALTGFGPVVIIGPNGSGKTRGVRNLTLVDGPAPEIINALRSTQMAENVAMMNPTEATNNVQNSRNSARNQHWQIQSDFDIMIAKILADDNTHSSEFKRAHRNGQPLPEQLTTLERIEQLWPNVFPGRTISFANYRPLVTNTVGDAPAQYVANYMSDGEKAALYLMAKVMNAEPGVVVIDEPETHFHSLLAVQLWDALEAARPDLRFVYVTHDLTFGLSRRDATFLLANPKTGLSVVEVGDNVAGDIVSVLLGSASFSFYAQRVIVCEGEESSLDAALYKAWFAGPHTVVVSVGSCDRVMRSVSTLKSTNVFANIDVQGLIDRDFYADVYLTAVAGVVPVGLHEVESLFCIPEIAEAVASYVAKDDFDKQAYVADVRASFTQEVQDRVVLERWKKRLEPQLESLVASLSTKTTTLAAITGDIPNIFDYQKWSFSPAGIMAEEQQRVTDAIAAPDLSEAMKCMPAKHLPGIAARHCGISPDRYQQLVLVGLTRASEPQFTALGAAIEQALQPHLPPRSTP